MSDSPSSRIRRALLAEDGRNALRDLAVAFSADGCGRDEIYHLFLGVYEEAQSAGRENHEDVLGDVMDMIVGWCGPAWRLDLPD